MLLGDAGERQLMQDQSLIDEIFILLFAKEQKKKQE